MPEIRVVANYTVKSGRTAEVLDLLREFRSAVRREDGNVAFDVFQHVDDPDRVVLIERYVSRDAFQQHREAPHFTEFAAVKIIPLLADRVVELYDITP